MANDTNPENLSSDPDAALSKEELERVSHRFKDLERDLIEIEAWTRAQQYHHLRELAGAELEDMLRSKEDTLKYISNPNPNLRQAAVRLAYDHWDVKHELAWMYEQMALTDTDNDVREIAIRAL